MKSTNTTTAAPHPDTHTYTPLHPAEVTAGESKQMTTCVERSWAFGA